MSARVVCRLKGPTVVSYAVLCAHASCHIGHRMVNVDCSLLAFGRNCVPAPATAPAPAPAPAPGRVVPPQAQCTAAHRSRSVVLTCLPLSLVRAQRACALSTSPRPRHASNSSIISPELRTQPLHRHARRVKCVRVTPRPCVVCAASLASYGQPRWDHHLRTPSVQMARAPRSRRPNHENCGTMPSRDSKLQFMGLGAPTGCCHGMPSGPR